MPKFVVRLKKIHDESGHSRYQVWKETGVSPNTIAKYVTDEAVEQRYLPAAFLALCEYYGVNWHDVVDVIPNGTHDAKK